MSDKPTIYGNCPAGCKWRVPHYDDFVEVKDKVAALKASRTLQDISIAVSNWTADETIAPFAFKASKSLTLPEGDNITLSLIVDSLVQAKYGIALGKYASGSAVFYAATKPDAAVSVTVEIEVETSAESEA